MRSYERPMYLRSYCVRENLFTGGCCVQYDTMLKYYEENPKNLKEVATMIWICSCHTTKKTIEEIEKDLIDMEENL